MDNVNIDTAQIKILEDFFDDLSVMDQRGIFLNAFRKASKPLIARAKANAPYRTGKLQKSIGSIGLPDEIAILVGAKKGGKYKGWHGHLIENGTVERFRRKKKAAPTGRVIGSHFFENAYNSTEEQIFSTIDDEWRREIDNLIIRTNKKLSK